ncbi:cytochrome-c peroxidase [Sphingobacterium siyangense]|uniref:cytochrome-c peroxidase n=1 Tax=Sphingobacterium siyangense TaxID=459529 RepID=UPI0030190D8B
MSKNMRVLHFGFLLLANIMLSCQKETVAPVESEDNNSYVLEVPANFPQPAATPDNPLTKAGVELGRRLFYEPLLSSTMTVSCASCHHQDRAFSDGMILSNLGISGKALDRHSPALFNLAWANNGLFWDVGSKNLESQAFGPLTHEDEMGIYFPEMVDRLRANPSYVSLFKEAFGESPTAAGVVKALAQFQRTIISANSKYDRYKRGDRQVSFSEKELLGMQLVQAKCGGCHSSELFTDNKYHNNGIDADFSDDSKDWVYKGRYRISYDIKDLGAYKTPSLRNIMVSAPYMHDGRFSTIDEVLRHYRSGIKNTIYTDQLLFQDNGKAGILLSDKEVEAVKAFLMSLTDEKLLSEAKYADSR